MKLAAWWRRGALIILSFMIGACALPPVAPIQDFRSERELRAISLGREGLSLLSQGRYPEAEGKLRQALYLSPESWPMRTNLAASLAGSEQFDEAEQILIGLEIEGAPPQGILLRRAHIALLRRDFATSEEISRRLLVTAIEKADWSAASTVTHNLKSLSFKLGDIKAARCFSEMSYNYTLSTDEALSHVQVLLALGESSRASAFLDPIVADKHLEIDPRVMYLRAQIAVEEGDLAKAWKISSELEKGVKLGGDLLQRVEKLRYCLVSDDAVKALATEVELDVLKEEEEDLLTSIKTNVSGQVLYPPKLAEMLQRAVERAAQ